MRSVEALQSGFVYSFELAGPVVGCSPSHGAYVRGIEIDRICVYSVSTCIYVLVYVQVQCGCAETSG